MRCASSASTSSRATIPRKRPLWSTKGKASEPSRFHHRESAVGSCILGGGGRLSRHDVADQDVERVQPGGDHAQCQIPIREDTDGAVLTIHDDDAADAALLHTLRRRAGRFSDGCDVDFVAGGSRDGCHGTARVEGACHPTLGPPIRRGA
jgi:hypothetical protein